MITIPQEWLQDFWIKAAFVNGEFCYDRYYHLTKYFSANGAVWEIKRFPDSLWRDRYGCIYALAEGEDSVDNIDRCGVGSFSLPLNHPANDACKAHDYKYSSPAYQLYYSRASADADLKRDLELVGYPVLGKVFSFISRLFGGKYWENNKTR